MKLEIGMYVRTKKGSIAKVLGFDIFEEGKGTNIENLEAVYFDEMLDNIDKDIYRGCFNEVFKNAKASHNIIDLIEINDIIQIRESIDNYSKSYFIGINEMAMLLIIEERIEKNNLILESVLTHEQFENNCYKIGDE